MVLIQTAAQQLPQVYVTLQQPPGLPFWETTIVSAVVGTCFGVASSVVMEYLKPYISKRLMRKTAIKDLSAEFRVNYATILDGIRILEDALASESPISRQRAMMMIGAIQRGFSVDRYNYYYESHKPLFYEIDDGFYLGKFCKLCSESIGYAVATHECSEALAVLTMAKDLGMEYMKQKGIEGVVANDHFYNIYLRSRHLPINL